jgi:hypothetical protein
MDIDAHNTAPESVEIVYRLVGGTHVFSSKGITGLVHVGSHDRAKAFESVLPALNMHVGDAYGCKASYKFVISYSQFEHHVAADDDIVGNFLTLTLDQSIAA